MSKILPVSRSRREDLGLPIPDDPHGVSVCLPLWEHNIGYEEGDPTVTDKMQCGYPRFFLHPSVRELMSKCEQQFANEGECCFVFPTARSAQRCADFVAKTDGVETRTAVAFDERVHVTVLPESARKTAMACWQHSGDIVSSRMADSLLGRSGLTVNVDDVATGADAKSVLKRRVAEMSGADESDVFLFPCGMSAIYAGYRALSRLRPNSPSVQFGFPYVDILKVQQRFALGSAPEEPVFFYPRGSSADIDQVEQIASSRELMGLFTEFPSNPLLRSPDLQRLAEMSERFDFPILVDDTLGACINVDAMPAADLIGTSLTKYFSGAGDVAAGALILNRDKPGYARIRAAVEAEFEDILFDEDAVVLERNSRDYADRAAVINANSQAVCDFFAAHQKVEDVWYPSRTTTDRYAAFQRDGAGFGGLMSIVLKDAGNTTPDFFDALELPKGPNLGTNFTLLCPYTILAHYNELDFAEACGISRYLIRISVGMEPVDWIIDRFSDALDQV